MGCYQCCSKHVTPGHSQDLWQPWGIRAAEQGASWACPGLGATHGGHCESQAICGTNTGCGTYSCLGPRRGPLCRLCVLVLPCSLHWVPQHQPGITAGATGVCKADVTDVSDVSDASSNSRPLHSGSQSHSWLEQLRTGPGQARSTCGLHKLPCPLTPAAGAGEGLPVLHQVQVAQP